jgi:hypothetical protein
MDRSEVTFLEFAGAQAVGDSVEMTLLAPIGGDPNPRPIYIRMNHELAKALDEQLMAAAIQVVIYWTLT